jgi:hypothetical protein
VVATSRAVVSKSCDVCCVVASAGEDASGKLLVVTHAAPVNLTSKLSSSLLLLLLALQVKVHQAELFGFGGGMYKNLDPRSTIMRKVRLVFAWRFLCSVLCTAPGRSSHASSHMHIAGLDASTVHCTIHCALQWCCTVRFGCYAWEMPLDRLSGPTLAALFEEVASAVALYTLLSDMVELQLAADGSRLYQLPPELKLMLLLLLCIPCVRCCFAAAG